LKNKDRASALSKDIADGERCTIIGHLIKAENDLGRSLIVDLDFKGPNKFR